MRLELLYNPALVIERVAEEIQDRRRLAKLKKTMAKDLDLVHITTLEFLELVAKNKQVNTLFDIGGNVGTWSQLAKSVLPHATIHAFEPIPEYQNEFLKNTISSSDSVVLHKVGVGSENKKAKINVAGHSSSFLEIGSSITNMFPSEKKSGEIEVDMIRLDDYIKTKNIPWPDLIKLDAEGYEIEILSAATECLKHAQYVITEVSFIERHIGQPLFHDIVTFMAKHNFYITAFPHHMLLGNNIIMTDVLFVKR